MEEGAFSHEFNEQVFSPMGIWIETPSFYFEPSFQIYESLFGIHN